MKNKAEKVFSAILTAILCLGLLQAITFPPIDAQKPAENSPSIQIDEGQNTIFASLGAKLGSMVTIKGTVTNVGNSSLSGLLTGVFFNESNYGLNTTDISCEWSPNGVDWYPTNLSTAEYDNYQVELILGPPGGYSLNQSSSSTTYVRTTANRDLYPILVEVIVFVDENLNYHYDVNDTIVSTGDYPVKVDLFVWHTVEIDGKAQFYYTISDAIVGAIENDTIWVYQGIYCPSTNETFPITINTRNLTIGSIEGANLTIISGEGHFGPAFHILANNIILKGFGIKNFSADLLHDVGGILIEGNNSIINHIVVENIYNATVEPAGIGIDVHARNVKVVNSVVHDVGSIGIRIRDHWKEDFPGPRDISNNVLIENNTIYRTNNTCLVITGYAKGVIVRNNKIYESLKPTPYNILIHYNSSDILIENNIIRDAYSNIVLAGCSNITISGNIIANTTVHPADPTIKGKNIYILNDYNNWTGNPDLLSTDVEIIENDILNGGYGIRLFYTGAGNFTLMASTTKISYNNIVGNTEFGVENTLTNTTVNAQFNWWGNETGPYNPSTNPSGGGSNVSDYVDYVPWLIRPYPPAVPIPQLYVDSVTLEGPMLGDTFSINVTLINVTNLCGFEFKLYWNTSLLNLVTVKLNIPWASYFVGKNETNETIGRYWVGVAANASEPPFNGSTVLATLTYEVAYVPIYPEIATSTFVLNDTILGDPDGNPIIHLDYDGQYVCLSEKARIELYPQIYEAKMMGQTLQVNVTITNISNLAAFEFELRYNTSLLDVQDVTVTINGSTYRVARKVLDDIAGLVAITVDLISPPLATREPLKVASVTFEVTYAVIWPNPPVESPLNLTYTTLITETGESLDHDSAGGIYRYRPIPGDLNSDGIVNIIDLVIVAKAYGCRPGDTNWNPIADVNGDEIINILDLIPIARNYGRTD